MKYILALFLVQFSLLVIGFGGVYLFPGALGPFTPFSFVVGFGLSVYAPVSRLLFFLDPKGFFKILVDVEVRQFIVPIFGAIIYSVVFGFLIGYAKSRKDQ